MRPMFDADRQRNPITIYVDTTVSAGFSPKQIRARGAAIAALAVKVSQTRPVQLFALAAMKPSGQPTSIATVDLGVSPLNVPLVTFALANAQFLRQVMFARTAKYGGEGGRGWIQWPWNESNGEKRNPKLRKATGMDDNAVLFNGAYLADEMVTRPIEWVENELRKMAPEQFEDEEAA